MLGPKRGRDRRDDQTAPWFGHEASTLRPMEAGWSSKGPTRVVVVARPGRGIVVSMTISLDLRETLIVYFAKVSPALRRASKPGHTAVLTAVLFWDTPLMPLKIT